MYGFTVALRGDFKTVKNRTVLLLKEEGFGVLTEIDVQATLKAKLGVERTPYVILGACNPTLANQAIDAEPDVGLLLPCNVIVREQGDRVVVGFLNPTEILGLVDREELAPLGAEITARLERVRDALRREGESSGHIHSR
jgi:uncharacterized protein (DUF302 family)